MSTQIKDSNRLPSLSNRIRQCFGYGKINEHMNQKEAFLCESGKVTLISRITKEQEVPTMKLKARNRMASIFLDKYLKTKGDTFQFYWDFAEPIEWFCDNAPNMESKKLYLSHNDATLLVMEINV